MDKTFGIKDLIEQIHKELIEMQEFTKDKYLEITNIEIEASMTASLNQKGKINLQVVEVGGGIRSEEVQKVTVSFKINKSPIIDPSSIQVSGTHLRDSKSLKATTQKSSFVTPRSAGSVHKNKMVRSQSKHVHKKK